MSLLRPPLFERARNFLTAPYEEWRHRIFMEGWNAGYDDCERHNQVAS